MIPHLESIHVDVLSQIAFFTVASTPFDGLGAILQLLLCSRRIYNALCLKSCPQLYARVFRTRFDLVAHLRRNKLSSPTTTALASEFHRRCMVLQRIRRSQVPQHSILPDLWTIYLMLLESDGMNESQLHAAGIAQYVLMLFKCHLGQLGGLHDITARALTISIACLVWSHKFIIHLPAEERGQMLAELRPFVTGSINVPSPHVHNRTTRRCPPNGLSNRAVGACIPNKHRALVFSFYSKEHTLTAPSLLSASIFLTFALKEATALQVPKHLPTQAIARATERHGPTMEDFLIITRRRTPLLADSVYQSSFRECFADRAGRKIRASRSLAHDEEFYRIARRLDFSENTWELRACIGLLSGTWEGISQDITIIVLQPIQCRLEEHLCFSPCVPLPSVSQDSDFGQSAFQHLYMNGCEGAAKANEFSYATGAPKHRYELFRPSDTSENDRDPRQALDVVITGETPRMLDAAWGAYIFFGRIRLSDGLVTLTRKPKYSGDEGRGTWIFEGYIHGRRSFVGRWRSFGASKDESLRGIFSLTKVEEPASHLD
ncbi:hypothetical protein AZE42_01342 [Rhizopogon vesiculosus]|uniref:Uncharacterized protein n=1 Tax=Rhizopogon vesiculosus TaxID=180088 RepID=A0A1J8Q1U6_9AGAM|nr:hypothetical protein AZE42_01342 [Rhizopogon vesiculosus]